jgi:hypothetical protein
MTIKINWNEPGMALASKGLDGCFHRNVAFTINDAILEVRKHLSTAREFNKPSKLFRYISPVGRISNPNPDCLRVAKIELVEKKLVELLDFVLDWEKDTLDD